MAAGAVGTRGVLVMRDEAPITIDEHGAAHVAGDALDAAARALGHQQHLYLRGLFGGELLAEMLALVDAAEYRPRRTAVGSVEAIDEDAHREFLEQLVHLIGQSSLCAAVERAFGLRGLVGFSGTIVRRWPGGAHHSDWHSDVTRAEHELGRAVAMVVNLSSQPFEGGNLLIREANRERVLARVAYREPGDAVLFRVTPRHEHRVDDVVGGGPRTVLTGWFYAPRAALA